MKRGAGFTLLFTGLSLFLIGCSEEPNSSGVGLIPDSLSISKILIISTSDSTYLQRIGGNQSILLTGKTADFEARSLLEFSFPAFDSTARIDSGVLTMRIASLLPDSGGHIEVQLHEMVKTWSDATFRWDSISNSYDTTSSGSSTTDLSASDTTVRIRIDTTLLRKWLVAGKGSAMLIPSNSSTSIFGYYSHLQVASGKQPVLEISYTDSTDTVKVLRRNAVKGVFVANGTVPTRSDLVFAQAGIAYRGFLKFGSLPLPPRVSITEAVFELRPDPGETRLTSYSRDTISVILTKDWVPPIDSLVLTVLCIPVTENGVKLYRGELKTFIQLWNTTAPNLGMVLRAVGELTTLDRFAIYNSSSTDSLRPRIRITYVNYP